MTVEVVSFIFLGLCAIFFATIKLNDKLYFIMSFLIFSIYSVIVRYSGYDVDFYMSYAPAMKSNSVAFYYLKEPIYWFTSRFLYSFINVHQIVFITIDVACFILLLYVQSRLKLPRYFPFLFLGFFPALLGMQNVYRQFIASFFLLVTLACAIEGGRGKKYLSFFLAVLSHSSSILLLPLLFITTNKTKKIGLIFYTSALFVFSLVIFKLNNKQFDTGEVSPFIYTVVTLIVYFFYIVSMQKITQDKMNDFVIVSYISTLIVLITVIASGGVAKRIGMIGLSILIIFIIRVLEDRYKNKKFMRVTLIVTIYCVTLIFPNTRDMLTGVNSVFLEW